jgi:hypothetical protein
MKLKLGVCMLYKIVLCLTNFFLQYLFCVSIDSIIVISIIIIL